MLGKASRQFGTCVGAAATVLVAACTMVSVARAEPNAAAKIAGTLKVVLSSPNGVAYPASINRDYTDPEALLNSCLESYRENIRDYRCLFFKQERVNGKLKKREGIQVAYRERPLSVSMTWFENRNRVKRATYVAGRNLNGKGEPCAIIEPAGAIARLVAGDLDIPIHGERARKAGRHTIDEFGFRSMLERFLRVNELAEARGDLELKYHGSGEFNGRATHVIVRELPYCGEKGVYPEAKLVMHLDQEWNVPVAAYSYADCSENTLLAAYEIKNVQLNAHLSDDAFAPAMK